MKILKILLILLVPAFGIVSCEKSDLKPGCGNAHNKQEQKNDNTAPTQVNSRLAVGIEESIESTDVVGSGDDDRDGGDKKTKKIR